MRGYARQHVGEPGLRIDVAHLGRDDQAVHHRRAFAAAIRAAEQPTLICSNENQRILLTLTRLRDPNASAARSARLDRKDVSSAVRDV
jgi:hypothetical protein